MVTKKVKQPRVKTDARNQIDEIAKTKRSSTRPAVWRIAIKTIRSQQSTAALEVMLHTPELRKFAVNFVKIQPFSRKELMEITEFLNEDVAVAAIERLLECATQKSATKKEIMEVLSMSMLHDVPRPSFEKLLESADPEIIEKLYETTRRGTLREAEVIQRYMQLGGEDQVVMRGAILSPHLDEEWRQKAMEIIWHFGPDIYSLDLLARDFPQFQKKAWKIIIQEHADNLYQPEIWEHVLFAAGSGDEELTAAIITLMPQGKMSQMQLLELVKIPGEAAKEAAKYILSKLSLNGWDVSEQIRKISQIMEHWPEICADFLTSKATKGSSTLVLGYMWDNLPASRKQVLEISLQKIQARRSDMEKDAEVNMLPNLITRAFKEIPEEELVEVIREREIPEFLISMGVEWWLFELIVALPAMHNEVMMLWVEYLITMQSDGRKLQLLRQWFAEKGINLKKEDLRQGTPSWSRISPGWFVMNFFLPANPDRCTIPLSNF
ncbi:MAG: hypothetical protein U0519_03320 [Candidatus Gracilibacteria bacterium]